MEIESTLMTAILNKRLIFTVTTGRSGTGHLAKLLSILPNVASFHEPEPQLVEAMPLARTNYDVAKEFLLSKKLPRIAKISEPIYIETSHLMGKGFLKPLLDLGIVPDLILLSRPHREVALSLFQLNTIPGRTEDGINYYVSPNESDFLPLNDFQKLHDYQLCYWYCLETERRKISFNEDVTQLQGKVIEIQISELNSGVRFKKFLQEMDLPNPTFLGWLKYFNLTRKKTNQKKNQKKNQTLPEQELYDLEQELINNYL